MRIQLKPALTLALIAAGIFALAFAIDRIQPRAVRSDRDLLYLLPGGDATVFFARVDVLRSAGLLSLLAGSKAAEDPEYRAFVHATDFDYARDMDAVAGSSIADGLLLAVRGRFAWSRIRSYVQAQGGTCAGDSCEVAARDGKFVGIKRVQRDVLAVAIGANKDLVGKIHPGQSALAGPVPSNPVWVSLAPSLLRNPARLPTALRIFAMALQGANSVVLSLAPPAKGSQAAFDLKLDATCAAAANADMIRAQLQMDTNVLRMELSHAHEQLNPADLTGLLTAGSFAATGTEVTGTWPVSKELLKTLQ